ncbi:hypothetical protein IQ230_02085 [Gloeocapsopsis crepidinum LEGE 06123]|uniref:MarR family transcriptional regulator n=1 Tax=Gloeocapsopsis crepidinum LEGE 06123 TaxID=588587 RepID=A0ABR9ULP6_9CHRO|nr:hypothetical protein [Gloeocapsopsis crepidinum]MBE9189174.1 hypothetical protein [Gloeocapsopsis crepidinum LEGE 06123]
MSNTAEETTVSIALQLLRLLYRIGDRRHDLLLSCNQSPSTIFGTLL